MRVHLFGLPLSLHRRLKCDSDNWHEAVPAGHYFRASPILSNQLAPLSESELKEIEVGVNDGFTHIIIPANRNWEQVKRKFQFDCRIHIARIREPLRDLTWPILQESLHRVVQMDNIWLDRFCPQDLRHALLLPSSVFATEKETASYWSQCDVYNTDSFEYGAKLLLDVTKRHWRHDSQGKHSWLDTRNRRFRIDPSMHAPSIADRHGRKSFRFCFEVPCGFHYDVTHEHGDYFKIELDNRIQSVRHCNISPWGHIRRGKNV
jgi:hypothetical protein